MTATLKLSDKRPQTLPNCDGCGRFTSSPAPESVCVDAGESFVCFEWLICPRCVEPASRARAGKESDR